MLHTLERTTFETSRLLEFFSEKELAMQMGCPKDQWPLALLKELIDNALDACETAGLLPEIEVMVEPDLLSVRDHGPGVPLATLERSLDYVVRVSDKVHYVSPTRGQPGNALKCLRAAPFVAAGEAGSVEVVTCGITHRIAVSLDRIGQAPELRHMTTPDGCVKNGTRINLIWPEIASSLVPSSLPIFYKGAADLLLEYGAFNPHASLRYQHGERQRTIRPTTPDWDKWLPRDPTSPHWYTTERLRMLIAAYLTDERRSGRVRTVREFVAEFRGLSSSAKQKAVTTSTGLSGAYLNDLVEGGDVALACVNRLLTAMQRESREVKAEALGVLGEAHISTYLSTHYQVEPISLKYRKLVGVTEGLPFVLEVACGWYATETAAKAERRNLIGINWTPALKPPFVELPALLGEARVDSFDPVIVLVHLAMPRVEFTDRGKSAVALPMAVREALATGIVAVTKHWTALKRQADRAHRVHAREQDHWLKQQRQYLSIKEAAYEVMEDAYRHASAQGQYPANARQIMYAARPAVLALTGDKCWKRSSYFTQELLPDFIEEHPEQTAAWDVVFDDRGHLVEPHTHYRIGLGTLAVRNYIGDWHEEVPTDVGSTELDHDCPTVGPANRYRFALFLEKEGFYPLLEAAQIAERYDIAIMSTKGMSVIAARKLVDDMSQQGVTVLVCHDFDKSGFSIFHTLCTDTRRYTFQARPTVVDLGLRLADVQAMDLQSEPVSYPRGVDPGLNLRECGATEQECHSLVQWDEDDGWSGQRVELNAMTSEQFLGWLEQKLADAGVQKVIPDQAALENAYRRAVRQKRVQAAIEEALTSIDEDEEIPIPSDLDAQIREQLDGSAQAWDHVLWNLVADDEIEDEDGEASEDREACE